jgi:hypothetical protein
LTYTSPTSGTIHKECASGVQIEHDTWTTEHDANNQRMRYGMHLNDQDNIVPKNVKMTKHPRKTFDQTSQAVSHKAVPNLGLTQRNIKRFKFGRLLLKSLKTHFKSKLKTILY